MGKVDAAALWLCDATADDWLSGSVGEVLREVALRDGDRDFLRYAEPDGSLSVLSYAQACAGAERMARALLERVAPGDAIAIIAPNSANWVQLELAGALAGIVLVPLNPAMEIDEIAYIVDLTQPRIIFSVIEFRGKQLGHQVAGLAAKVPGLEAIDLHSWAQSAHGTAKLPVVCADAPFIVQYTSGTTGRPKGAVHTHAAALNAGASWCRDWGHVADDVLATAAPMFHVGGSICVVLGTLATSACMALMPAYQPGALLDLLTASGATVLAAVPTILFDLLDEPELGSDRLPLLHTVMGGGALVPPDTIRRIERKLGVSFIVTYGQSEAPAVLQTRRDDPIATKATTLGRPLPGRDVQIVRIDGATAAENEIGEICVRSRVLMSEYLKRPEATAEAFDADGWLHTGDLGAMDEKGWVLPHGRARDVIIRGGENIYPDEVENVLRLHPSVADIAVVAAPDPRYGEIPVGFVINAGGQQLDGDELIAFGRTRLAGFKVPRRWIAVTEFPRTAMGKVRKVVLREQLTRETVEAVAKAKRVEHG